MPERFEQTLNELLTAGVITEDTQQKIREYLASKEITASPNRLVLVFGILGALLVGLGAILIIAHNWDQLPRMARLAIAFLPLIASQVFCGWTVFSATPKPGLKEIASTLLFFAIGTCIALVSQIYHVEGNLATFLLAWSILYIPVIYLAQSSLASLLSLVLIGYYGVQAGYMNYTHDTNWYFLLLATIIPFYISLLRTRPYGNATIFHHWLIAISLTSILASFSARLDEIMFAGYASLFGCFYLLGNLPFFRAQKRRSSGYLVIGSIGLIVVILICSFEFVWTDWARQSLVAEDLVRSPELYAFIALTICGIVLLRVVYRQELNASDRPLQFVFLLFAVIFLIGHFSPGFGQLSINLLLLAISVLVIRKGMRTNRLEILNYGLLILSALIICRFFDTDMSFLLRGFLFMGVGAGFFIANYQVLSRRKKESFILKNPLP